MDGYADELLALARPGHHGGNGGGEPHPSTVTSVQHAGAVAVPEQAAPAHIKVQEGGGEELTALDSGGGKGGHIKGVQRLWTPPSDGNLLQIPGESDLGGR